MNRNLFMCIDTTNNLKKRQNNPMIAKYDPIEGKENKKT